MQTTLLVFFAFFADVLYGRPRPRIYDLSRVFIILFDLKQSTLISTNSTL